MKMDYKKYHRTAELFRYNNTASTMLDSGLLPLHQRDGAEGIVAERVYVCWHCAQVVAGLISFLLTTTS